MSGVGDVRRGGGNFVHEHDKEVQYLDTGKYGRLDCPVRSVSGSATICTFTDPEGVEYVLVGR